MNAFEKTKLYRNFFVHHQEELRKIYLFDVNENGKYLLAYDNAYEPQIIYRFLVELKDKQVQLQICFIQAHTSLSLKDINHIKPNSCIDLVYLSNENPIQELVDFILYINQKHHFSKQTKDSNLAVLSKLTWF